MTLRLGMVGGGIGSMIGPVHRKAAALDGRFQLVAGALSSTLERSAQSAELAGIAADRVYGDYREMAQREAARSDGIDAVVIVTPNHMHAPVAHAFLDAGIHVICDKPLTARLEDAHALAAKVAASGLVFAVTYNYSGYVMVRQARQMVANGAIGPIRVVIAEYAQEWLARPVERDGNRQAVWRTDPAMAGAGGALGDIGTHAFHLMNFVTGLDFSVSAAQCHSFVPGRTLDDNAFVTLEAGDARATIWVSQVAPGCRNGLSLRVFGETGALTFRQEEPDVLVYAPLGEAPQRLERGGPGMVPEAAALVRLPAGHPEGFLEGFANIYSAVADAIIAHREGKAPAANSFPTVADGVAGVAFVDAAVRHGRA